MSASVRRWGPAVAVQVAILVGLLLPSSAMPDGPDVLGVVFHIGTYGALAFALVRPGGLRRPAVVMALVLASALATEALQLLVESRATDPWDVVADLSGGTLGMIAAGFSLARSGAAGARSTRR